MTAIARPASPGHYFDTDEKLTLVTAAKLFAAPPGFIGCFRYLPLPAPNNPKPDIDARELEMLLSFAQFQVGLVQHVRDPGWDPRAHSGNIDGATAAQYALDAGYPTGSHIWQDLEGVMSGADAGGVIVYSNAWAERVRAAGFRAGLYVGFDVPLTPEQLHDDLTHDSYWSDAGHRTVAVRGCAIHQGKTVTVGGVRIDEDEISEDALGSTPWLASAV